MSKKAFFVSVSGGALILIIGFRLFLYTPAPPASDAAAWHTLAKSYAGYVERDTAFLRTYADREPGYPLFVGALYRIFGPNPSAVYFAQSVLFAILLTWFAWSMRAYLGDRIAAVMAIIISALPGVAAMTAGELLSEPFALSLLMACAALLASLRFTPRWGLICGLLLGLLALTRYIFLLLPPFFAVVVFVAGKRLIPRIPRTFLVFLFVGYAIPVLAWTARNYAVLGVVTPTGTKGGLEMIVPMKRIESLAGKDLFAYLLGSITGDAFARISYNQYVERVEPYFTNTPVLEEYTRKIFAADDPGAVNVSVIKTAGNIVLAHPLRFAVMGVAEFFRKNSPMLWHNAAEMQHLFAESASRSLAGAMRAAGVFFYRVIFFIPILFSLVVAVKILTRSGGRSVFTFMAVTILYTNLFYIFFVSSPRYGMLLYAFYGVFVVVGIGEYFYGKNHMQNMQRE